MSEQEDEGQVSEVVRLDPDEVDTPISDSDHVAGYPESESGEPDEGRETGPDAALSGDGEVRCGCDRLTHRGFEPVETRGWAYAGVPPR